MTFNINLFKENGLKFGGARPSLFQVELSLPPDLVGDNAALTRFIFTCRAASIPASSIAPVEVPYFGRKIKLAGDRTFADWSVTIMNDEDFSVRAMFERWSELMNTHQSNLKVSSQPNSYKSADALVTQFSKNGKILPGSEYVFVGMFPLEISAMDLDWEATNTIQTFNVTFGYDYWSTANHAEGVVSFSKRTPVTPVVRGISREGSVE